MSHPAGSDASVSHQPPAGPGATRAIELEPEQQLYIDGVDPSYTQGFIREHFGGRVDVPPHVHFLVFRQLVMTFTHENTKFRLSGPVVDGGLAHGGGPKVMAELLASRYAHQPGLVKNCVRIADAGK